MLNIIVCDDNLAYQEIIECKIKKCLQNTFDLECNVLCCNDFDFIKKQTQSMQVDIIFLDVMVSQKNSIDWLIENQKDIGDSAVILMTAYPEESYNLSDIDCCYYLIKPKLTDERLSKAIYKAINKKYNKRSDLVLIKSGNKNLTVNMQDVLYIDIYNNNIVLHMVGGEKIPLYTSLRKFAEQLPFYFLRNHKCYMVNMNHIVGFEPYGFYLTSGAIIPIPLKKYDEITKKYKKYFKNL